MYNITNYFIQYYVPNNMAICISGDISYEQTIALVEKYFGDYKSRMIPEWQVKRSTYHRSTTQRSSWAGS